MIAATSRSDIPSSTIDRLVSAAVTMTDEELHVTVVQAEGGGGNLTVSPRRVTAREGRTSVYRSPSRTRDFVYRSPSSA